MVLMRVFPAERHAEEHEADRAQLRERLSRVRLRFLNPKP